MTEKKNPAVEKSFAFALQIVDICRSIQSEKKELTLSKQLLRSGTSIGANVEEAVGSFSEKDFHFKFSLAYKEARESKYWIRLLGESGFIDEDDKNELLTKVEELLKILGSIIKTMKNKNK